MTYDHQKVEKKWQAKWEQTKLNEVDIENAKKPYYNLMMFPYPSAEGLHVGNMYAFTGSDIWGRFERMQGNNVFEPMGLDGFGIHSENYAIKIKEHIREVSRRTEKHFYEQLHMIGNQFDWSRKVETYKPDYYKWTQWLFVQMFKHKLAYRKRTEVNWCPSCKTVLSDEQVINGKCERCDSLVEKREMEQWFWRITDYAAKLLKNLEWINWSEEVKIGQKHWIGRSEGVTFKQKVRDMDIEFETFDTVPQTFTAQTFIVIAPEHPLVLKLVKGTRYEKEVMEFVKKVKKKKLAESFNAEKDIEGVFTGRYVKSRSGKGDLPIWVASYVLYEHGTGIVNCSAHDERDFEFAKKYNIPLRVAMLPRDPKEAEKVGNLEYCYHHAGDGIIQDPEGFKGKTWGEVREPIIRYIEKKGFGKRAVQYKLRDWCISRQRYWGPPIPMIYCEKCGWQAVPEKDLPVLLPDIEKLEDILPDGSGKGPLAKREDFVNTKCPNCGGKAKRETDVSDPFVDSCWYFLRYPSVDVDTAPFDKPRTKKWLPVDMYVGGKEHTVLHLLYSRFVTMALKDWGYIDFEEPFERFFGHGLLIKEGAKMSKSKGNVINPDEYIAKFGADAVRMYLMFLGDFRQGGDWRDTGMRGMYRFMKRIYDVSSSLIQKFLPKAPACAGRDQPMAGNLKNQKLVRRDSYSKSIHVCIKGVEGDIKRLRYNTAISKLMIFFNGENGKPDWRCKVTDTGKFEKVSDIGIAFDSKALEKFVLLLAPFAPFIAEELWKKLGNKFSIHSQRWPKYDPKLLAESEVTIAVQVNGKLRDTINVRKDAPREEVVNAAQNLPKVMKYTQGRKMKVIFIANRIVSFVG